MSNPVVENMMRQWREAMMMFAGEVIREGDRQGVPRSEALAALEIALGGEQAEQNDERDESHRQSPHGTPR